MSKELTAKEIIEIIKNSEDKLYRKAEGCEKTFGQDSEQRIRAENQWIALVKLLYKLGVEDSYPED